MQCKTFFWLVSPVINLVPRALFPGFGAQELKRPGDAVDRIPDQKSAKFIPVFRPKRRKNPTLWGSTYLYGLYKGGPPPPQLKITFLHNVSLR